MGREFAIALQFLTRIPVRVGELAPWEFAASARWFPLVGALIGALVGAALFAGSRIDPWLGALAALAVWVLVTGALHLDGLADLSDALGAAHRDPARFLEVLKDPHIGGFGVVAIVLAVAAKLVLLMLCATHAVSWAVLVLVPAWARYGAYVWSRTLAPLAPGAGARSTRREGPVGIVVWALALAALSVWLDLALIAALPLLLAWWLFLRMRLGGMTGDCLGAGIELVEIALLVCLVLAAG